MGSRRAQLIALAATLASVTGCESLIDANFDPNIRSGSLDAGAQSASGEAGIPLRAVEDLTSGLASPSAVILADERAFVSVYARPVVQTLNKSGGRGSSLVMAADSLPPCGGLVVSGVELAWAAGSVLQSVALSGGKSRVVYETDDPPFTRLAAFGGDLFVVDQSRVMRVPASGVGGGAATTLTTNPAGRVVDAIAADESGVYWTTEGGVGGMNAIRKISLSASSAASAVDLYVGEASSSSGNDLGGLALGPDDVVWTEPKRGRVVRIAKSGGEARALATGLSAPIGVAIDGAHVYVTVHGGASREGPDGRVVRIALAGGPVETLAEAQDGPRGIAVDATHVYFTNIEGGQTRRIAK